MPYEVLLSQVHDAKAFDKAVREHVAALHAFAKQVGTPRPTAHPLVEASIKRTQQKGAPDVYKADYVVKDDVPVPEVIPEPTLEIKKSMLHEVLNRAENEAKYKILPQRRMRLLSLKMSIAMSVPEDQRSAEQREDVASYLLVQKAWQAIDLIGAQAESDLDDLTQATIDKWQPPKFG